MRGRLLTTRDFCGLEGDSKKCRLSLSKAAHQTAKCGFTVDWFAGIIMFLVQRRRNDGPHCRGSFTPLEVKPKQRCAVAYADRAPVAEIDFQSALLVRSAVAGRVDLGKQIGREPRDGPQQHSQVSSSRLTGAAQRGGDESCAIGADCLGESHRRNET